MRPQPIVNNECIRNTIGNRFSFVIYKIAANDKLTWDQWRSLPGGKRLKRFTSSTHALQISPQRGDASWKHSIKSSSYFFESVNRELLDLALHMQHPCVDRYTFGLWNENIVSTVRFFSSFFFPQIFRYSVRRAIVILHQLSSTRSHRHRVLLSNFDDDKIPLSTTIKLQRNESKRKISVTFHVIVSDCKRKQV